jgi:hypothetical protein
MTLPLRRSGFVRQRSLRRHDEKAFRSAGTVFQPRDALPEQACDSGGLRSQLFQMSQTIFA